MSDKKVIAESWRVIAEWDESSDGPMPDEYWTTCPRCHRELTVWHATDYVGCECGCIFDPSTGEECEELFS